LSNTHDQTHCHAEAPSFRDCSTHLGSLGPMTPVISCSDRVGGSILIGALVLSSMADSRHITIENPPVAIAASADQIVDVADDAGFIDMDIATELSIIPDLRFQRYAGLKVKTPAHLE
jgi:hypothetical protein